MLTLVGEGLAITFTSNLQIFGQLIYSFYQMLLYDILIFLAEKTKRK